MSLVTVHGPNTMYTAASGAVASTPPGGGTLTPVLSNGLQFTFAGAGDRAAADYDWTWTPTNAGDSPASPLNNTKTGTITFGVAGTKTVTLTLGSSGGTTPAPGTYTFAVTAVSGPRMIEGMSAPMGDGDTTIDEAAAEAGTFADEGAAY